MSNDVSGSVSPGTPLRFLRSTTDLTPDDETVRAHAGEVDTTDLPLEAVEDPDAMLQLITARGRALVPGSGFAALRCRRHVRWSTAAAADIMSHRYGDLHATYNQTFSVPVGTSGDRRQGGPVELRRVHGDAELARLGVQTIIIAPIETPREVFGTFNWYLPGDAEPADLDPACSFARHASLVYLHARERRHLTEAVEAKHRVGQAQGILMARLGLDADSAFAVLRRLSQEHNVKLQEVALRVVSEGGLPAFRPLERRRR